MSRSEPSELSSGSADENDENDETDDGSDDTEKEEEEEEEIRVLFAAALYGRADIIGSASTAYQQKLPEGSDLGVELGLLRNDGKSVLEVAAIHDKIDAVRALLRLAAFPSRSAEDEPATWLHGSCRAAVFAELMQQVALGDAARAEALLLLLGSPQPADCAVFGGDTPIHWAASFGQFECVERLIAAGVAVDEKNLDGGTALHEAAKGGPSRRDIALALLGAGADVNVAATSGKDAGKTAHDLAVGPDAFKELFYVAKKEVPAAVAVVAEEEQQPAARCRAPLVWPPPRRCRLLGSTSPRFELPKSGALLVACADSADAALRTLRVELGGCFEIVLVENFKDAVLTLQCSELTTTGPESYRIRLEGSKARIVGADAAGLSYGASTFAQLLRSHATTDADVWTLPALTVDDAPDARLRGAILDARACAAPKLAQLFDDARRLASWRYNSLFLEIDDGGYEALEAELNGEDAMLPWHSIDGGDGSIDDADEEEEDATLLDALFKKSKRRGMTVVATIRASGQHTHLERILGELGSAKQIAIIADGEQTESLAARAAKCGVEAVWLWDATDKIARSVEDALCDSQSCVVGRVIDGGDGEPAAGARLLRKRPTASESLVVGGAPSGRACALRQAPLLASLVVAARAARAERCAGLVVRSEPAACAAFPRPFRDATALLGAGLAWRADAGADSAAAGGGRALSQAELEAVTTSQLWRFDPPRTRDEAESEDKSRRSMASSAASLICGRRERVDPLAEGRGRSLLSECQRGEHLQRVDLLESHLWPPTSARGSSNDARDFLEALCESAQETAQSADLATALRSHHKRLSTALKSEEDLWNWGHDQLGFFFDPADNVEPFYTKSDGGLVLFSVPARSGVEDLSRRLGHVLDELHVAVDLCRWMARLQQILVARAREKTAFIAGDARSLVAAVPSGTRSDVANRLLELLQRGALVWARRHSASLAPEAFAAAPPFLAEITFDLANFKPAELDRLMFAATTQAEDN